MCGTAFDPSHCVTGRLAGRRACHWAWLWRHTQSVDPDGVEHATGLLIVIAHKAIPIAPIPSYSMIVELVTLVPPMVIVRWRRICVETWVVA